MHIALLPSVIAFLARDHANMAKNWRNWKP